MSCDVVRCLAPQFDVVKPFRMDVVYIGMLANRSGVTPVSHNGASSHSVMMSMIVTMWQISLYCIELLGSAYSNCFVCTLTILFMGENWDRTTDA